MSSVSVAPVCAAGIGVLALARCLFNMTQENPSAALSVPVMGEYTTVKIFQIANPNNWHFVHRAVLLKTGHWAGSVVSEHGLVHSTDGSQYSVYQNRNIRLNMSQAHPYFLIANSLFMMHGAFHVQAKFIACATV